MISQLSWHLIDVPKQEEKKLHNGISFQVHGRNPIVQLFSS